MNTELTERLRAVLTGLPRVEEKRMFGGTAFMVNGKLCMTARPGRLMCRIDPEMHERVIRRPGTRTVRMKGREYKGYVYVDESEVRSARELRYWVGVCLDYNWKARASR
jgi:TfoX/Sxy family transcriptional regulator of competence genes